MTSRLDRLASLLDKLDDTYAPLVTFKKFVQSFPGNLCIYDREYMGLAFSEEFCKTLGYSENYLMDDRWQELVHPEELEVTTEASKKMKQVRVEDFRNRWKRADGEYVTLSWKTGPWIDLGDGKEYTICVAEVIDD